jgi:hypothetical protein
VFYGMMVGVRLVEEKVEDANDCGVVYLYPFARSMACSCWIRSSKRMDEMSIRFLDHWTWFFGMMIQ